jgi:hypothetical protein
MGIVRAQSQAASDDAAVASVPTTFKHLLLPIMDKNPYLSAATQQAAATTTSLANMYGADITVVGMYPCLRGGGPHPYCDSACLHAPLVSHFRMACL